MITLRTLTATLAIALSGACAAATPGDDVLPAGASNFPPVSTPVSEAADDVLSLDNVNPPTTTPQVVEATSCDVVREALLTGTPAEIEVAMLQLKADRSADAKAREYAADYLTQTNADLQRMNVSLLRMLCS